MEAMWEQEWEKEWMEEDKAKSTATQEEATWRADEKQDTVRVPAIIAIAGTTPETSHRTETQLIQHVEPADEEEKKEDEAWEQELMRRSKLDPHAGNVMTPDKPEGSFRLWWGNLGFLSAWRSDVDSQHFINQLAHNQVDMACVCEPNLQWHKVDTHNNWYERSTQVLGPQTFQFAYNQHDRNNTSTKQMGGTGIIARLKQDQE